MLKLSFPPHGEEEAVYQKHDHYRRPQIKDSQGNGPVVSSNVMLAMVRGVAGGENGLIPGARRGAVHQRNHHRAKPRSLPDSRQKGLNPKFQEAADEYADGGASSSGSCCPHSWAESEERRLGESSRISQRASTYPMMQLMVVTMESAWQSASQRTRLERLTQTMMSQLLHPLAVYTMNHAPIAGHTPSIKISIWRKLRQKILTRPSLTDILSKNCFACPIQFPLYAGVQLLCDGS